MEYPSEMDVFETRKNLTNKITDYCRKNGLPGFKRIDKGRLQVTYQCNNESCRGCINGTQEKRVVNGKTSTKGMSVIVTKSIECHCVSIALQCLALGQTFENWKKAQSAIARYSFNELKMKEAYGLAENNSVYRNYRCKSRHCEYYPNCAGQVVVRKCMDGSRKNVSLIVPCSEYDLDSDTDDESTENCDESTENCLICKDTDISSYLVCGECRKGKSCVCQTCFDMWRVTRPPCLRYMGDVAQLYDEYKMCPMCRYSPVHQFQTGGANSKLVNIKYPYGFKDVGTAVMTELEFVRARELQLTVPAGGVSDNSEEDAEEDSEEDSEEEGENTNAHNQQEDANSHNRQEAIWFMMQSGENLSPAEYREGFRKIMTYGVYGVPMYLRLCYYRALLRVIFEKNQNWLWKKKRLREIARLARNDIFMCQQGAIGDDTIRDFCKCCIEVLQQKRSTREIIEQKMHWGMYAAYFHENLKVRRFVNMVED